jgi:hypothetical protein
MSDDLSRAMRSTADSLAPDIGKLTTGGFERGRHKRRVRLAAQTVGSAASVTAVFGAVAVFGLHGNGAKPGGSTTIAAGVLPATAAPTTTDARTPSASPPTTPSATPTSQSTAEGPPVSITSQQLKDALKQALAPYGFTSIDILYVGSSATSEDAVSAEVTGPHGVGSIGIGFSHTILPAGDVWGDTSAGDTKTVLPDGSILWTHSGPEYPAGNADPGENTNVITLFMANGVEVDLSTTNAAGEKGMPTSKDQPLTLDQLKTVATDGAWSRAVAAALSEPSQQAPIEISGPPTDIPSGKMIQFAPTSPPAQTPAQTQPSTPTPTR